MEIKTSFTVEMSRDGSQLRLRNTTTNAATTNQVTAADISNSVFTLKRPNGDFFTIDLVAKGMLTGSLTNGGVLIKPADFTVNTGAFDGNLYADGYYLITLAQVSSVGASSSSSSINEGFISKCEAAVNRAAVELMKMNPLMRTVRSNRLLICIQLLRSAKADATSGLVEPFDQKVEAVYKTLANDKSILW